MIYKSLWLYKKSPLVIDYLKNQLNWIRNLKDFLKFESLK